MAEEAFNDKAITLGGNVLSQHGFLAGLQLKDGYITWALHCWEYCIMMFVEANTLGGHRNLRKKMVNLYRRMPPKFLSFIECVCLARRIQYDGMTLHHLLLLAV